MRVTSISKIVPRSRTYTGIVRSPFISVTDEAVGIPFGVVYLTP